MMDSKRKSIDIPLETLELSSDLLGVSLSDMLDGKWDINELMKYKDLSVSDLLTIARFRRLCKNYLKIQRIENKHGIKQIKEKENATEK